MRTVGTVITSLTCVRFACMRLSCSLSKSLCAVDRQRVVVDMGQGLVECFDDEANRASRVAAVLELGYGLIVEIKGEVGTVGNDTQRVLLPAKPHDGIAASLLED